MPPDRVPVATYRLQMRKEFPLDAASALVPYLQELGVSDCYVSPLYTARPGSVHGYDVIDHRRLNPELGDDAALARFLDALAARRMGLVLDVVPNHMCIAGARNEAWLDVLEHGPAATSARFFDIDWRPPKQELVGKVLLPVLGEQYGRVLENGLTVGYANGGFHVSFYESRLPLAPRSWVGLLEPALVELRRTVGDEEPRVLELESIIRALGHLPLRTETSPGKVRERQHEYKAVKQRLLALCDGSAEVKDAIEHAVALVNGTAGDPTSFGRLEDIMADQAYRLAFWRVAAHEINYRRFFDINDLAAIRVEDPGVFAVVHQLPLAIARHAAFSGFRIDHVDGLLDPQGYVEDLQRSWRREAGRITDPSARAYLVVEKILTGPEELPREWPVDGATGYELGAAIAGVLVADGSRRVMQDVAARFLGERQSFREIVYESKKLVLRSALAAELTVLARKLDRISEQHRYTRDFTLNELQAALAEIIACFPVYRTYIRPQDVTVADRDRAVIETAIEDAKRRNRIISSELFDFVRAILLLEGEGQIGGTLAERRDWVLKFQQLTGPVMAKGVEDTSFYRYVPLVALNEVGAEPAEGGLKVAEFHERNRRRLELMPYGLSATATHDSKRGEDTRARLVALTEVAPDWESAVGRWRGLTAALKTSLPGGREAPDARDEYLFYQTLVGTWPASGLDREPEYRDRVKAYMRKARLEAKVNTSWVNPNQRYDDAVDRFVDGALDPGRSGAFLADLAAFVTPLVRAGYWNSLSQVVLKVASPGVPDFFQGTELWDFSLVDPDNRRLVDFETRRQLLGELSREGEARGAALAAQLLANPDDGRIKLWVTMRALRLRNRARRLFEQGSYEPLTATGRFGDHVIAFARRTDGGPEARSVLAIVGRRFIGLGSGLAKPVADVWHDTAVRLPASVQARAFRDAFTGAVVSIDGPALRLNQAFAHLPLALLEEVE